MIGSGTKLDPFIIQDVNDLQAMEDDLSAYYELGNDIDAAATSGWNAGQGFKPIGQSDKQEQDYLPSGDFQVQGTWLQYPVAGSMYEKVNDGIGVHDGDDSYIEATEPECLYTSGVMIMGVPSDATNIRIRTRYAYRRVDGGGSGFYPILRINGQNYRSSYIWAFSSYSWGSRNWSNNPATGEPWKAEDLAGLQEFGVEMMEDWWDSNVRITCMYLELEYSTFWHGSFDGKGHTIRNLYINRPAEGQVGLFGIVMNVEHTYVGNVILKDVDITGYRSVGAAAGALSSQSVPFSEKISASGQVTADAVVGGLFGSHGTKMRQCSSSCDVVGTGDHFAAGGLIGQQAVFTSIELCLATGSVNAPDLDSVGGFIGSIPCATGHDAVFQNCYARGNVEGAARVGGFIGSLCCHVTANPTFRNCYSTGAVNGSSYVGGFIGWRFSSPTIPKCAVHGGFWDIDSSGQATSDGGEGKTTAQMKRYSTFKNADWDIGRTSRYNPNDGYPFLSWQVGRSPVWLLTGGGGGWIPGPGPKPAPPAGIHGC